MIRGGGEGSEVVGLRLFVFSVVMRSAKEQAGGESDGGFITWSLFKGR